MAAPTRLRLCLSYMQNTCLRWRLGSTNYILQHPVRPVCLIPIKLQSTYQGSKHKWNRSKWQSKGGQFSIFAFASAALSFQGWKVYASEKSRPDIKPTKKIVIPSDDRGLKLTLFQYQTCPFCCKVRAYLDFHGFSYDIVEVNSVSRKQIKWSNYRKVPLLLVDDVGEDGFLELRDSRVIVSVLESYLEDPSHPMDNILSYYPCLESKEGRKKVYEYPNKYSIMYREKILNSSPEFRKEEKEWRQWADEVLVHMLSPNVYRTPSEALQAFRYFSDIGKWEKHFSTIERYMVIYVGATVMYFIGKMLKKKYHLKDDVRQSLFENCNVWINALGSSKDYMGGETPNMADLAVYGVLSSIEGCDAFQDVLLNTNIGPWYKRMQFVVKTHAGAHPLSKKTTAGKIMYAG